jgi:hypothetical protein
VTSSIQQHILPRAPLCAQAADPSTLLVLEETGGAYGGGCPNITDRFVSGFWWLHTLGVTGEARFGRVHRQDIAGGWRVIWTSCRLLDYNVSPSWATAPRSLLSLASAAPLPLIRLVVGLCPLQLPASG